MKEIQEYLDWKSSYAPTARRAYKTPLNSFSKEFANLNDITDNQLISYRQKISTSLAPASVNYAMVVIRDMLNFNLGKHNVNTKLIRLSRIRNKIRVVITQDEFNQINLELDEYKFTQLRNKVMLNMLWDTGVRISELVSLNISDISVYSKMASIETAKNKIDRTIMWGEKTQDMLIRYLGVRLTMNSRDELFINLKGGSRISVRSVQRDLSLLCKKLNLRQITPHSFRHAKAHRMLDRGANIKEIASVLGHSETNPTASFMYLKLDKREHESIVAKYV